MQFLKVQFQEPENFCYHTYLVRKDDDNRPIGIDVQLRSRRYRLMWGTDQ